MGFRPREILPLATREGLLQVITPEDIFHHYLGSLPTTRVSSPFREDKNASFSLFNSDIAGVMYKDFGTGEKGDCFVFVKRLRKLNSMNETYNLIARDFNLTQFQLDGVSAPKHNFSIIPKPRKKKLNRHKATLEIVRKEWGGNNLLYWIQNYGLNAAQLEYCGVVPISHYVLNGYVYVADEIAYAFIEYKDGKQTYKIYQPHSTNGKKWLNTNNSATWELWTQLPAKGNKLIITSSRKDAMVIKSLFRSGILTSCSLQSEGVMPKESVMNELKERFDEIYILYDNDFTNPNNPGRASGLKIANAFGITQLEIPEEMYKCKDISDLRQNWNAHNTKSLIINLIKDTK